MKIVCDCGNENEFNTINEDTGQQSIQTQDEGQYATIEDFNFWETHDTVGIVCQKCHKAIWLFT